MELMLKINADATAAGNGPILFKQGGEWVNR